MIKRYIIFWERSANSGVIGTNRVISARSPQEAVNEFGFNTAFVRHTVVEVAYCSEVVVIGKIN